MTAYLQDARRALEAAEAEHLAARDAAAAAYERRNEAQRALLKARDALAIARLFPDGAPLKIGDRVPAQCGYGPGEIVDVYLANRDPRSAGKPDDLTATVRCDDGALYPVKAKSTRGATS